MNYRIVYITDIAREVQEIRAGFINAYTATPYTVDDINTAYVYRQWLTQNGGTAGTYHVKEYPS